MKIQVDSGKCQGHNRCMIYAPEVFEVDDYGFAQVQNPGQDVPEEHLEKVRSAVENCPELAIVVVAE